MSYCCHQLVQVPLLKKNEFLTNLFESFALFVWTESQNLIGLCADWQSELTAGFVQTVRQSQVVYYQHKEVVCGSSLHWSMESSPCGSSTMTPDRGGKEIPGLLLPHCVPVCFHFEPPFTESL